MLFMKSMVDLCSFPDISEGLSCRTEITVQKSCFKRFAVQKPSEINFGMKEFKAYQFDFYFLFEC